MADPRWRELADRVSGFHLTDRAMLRAQFAFVTALRDGEPSPPTCRTYAQAVRRYFERFERDARAQLGDVDRALEQLYQRQYNLAAERGVALKRIEAVQGVLASLGELAPETEFR